ncbi:hypothetical protein IJ182_02630 [bacterium]|nr:hypothetical protein [bacterium]
MKIQNIQLNKISHNTQAIKQKNNAVINSNSNIKTTNIPSSAFKAKYLPSFGKYKKVGEALLKNRETGDDVTAVIKKESFGTDDISYSLFVNKKEAGYIDIKLDSLFPQYDYSIPEYENPVPDDIMPEVTHLRSILGDKYEGIGSTLLSLAIDESKKAGDNGALWLTSYKGYDRLRSTYRKDENPIPFYYKLGFKSPNLETDKKIKELIQKGEYDKLPESELLVLTPEAAHAKNKYFARNYTISKS